MYVCMYVCMHVCMYAYMYVYTYTVCMCVAIRCVFIVHVQYAGAISIAKQQLNVHAQILHKRTRPVIVVIIVMCASPIDLWQHGLSSIARTVS